MYYPHGGETPALAVFPFAGGQPVKMLPLTGGAGQLPHWTPDGRAISFINGNNIWGQPVAGGPPKPVTHFTSSDTIFDFDWSRDGHLVLSRGTRPIDAVLIKHFQ